MDFEMTAWMKNDLGRIADTDDLHISPLREDGKTYGTPTWIWSVVVDGALYVRAYNGRESQWYKAALRQKAGRITAAGMTKEVSPSSRWAGKSTTASMTPTARNTRAARTSSR